MPSVPTNRTPRKSPEKLVGVVKSSHRNPRKPSPNRRLRSGDKYFWYTSSDGVDRFVTSSGACKEPPQNIETFLFDPAKFADEKYPSTFPSGHRWPPKTAQDLFYPFQLENKVNTSPLSAYSSISAYIWQHSGDQHCVGRAHFDKAVCSDPWCSHTFKRWSASMASWQDHFELRKTMDRGIGVYTKRAFQKRDVLGWYAGEILPDGSTNQQSDYLMNINIGIVSDDDDAPPHDDNDDDDDYTEGRSRRRSKGPRRKKRKSADHVDAMGPKSVTVDSQRVGNWTRFINHSCDALLSFFPCRVGDMRVMVVLAEKNIPAGVELTVNYGEHYYGKNTTRVCVCGAKKCVSRPKKAKK
jgi:hypothetical protein